MQIKKNENIFDRFVKVLVGAIVLFLIFYFKLNIILFLALLVFALFCVVTGLVGYCPLYNLLGINTERKC